jgi:hypothetical protein
MQGVANVLKNIDYLQKALGLNLFDLTGLTTYQKEQRIVATEFKSIGDTVDSLKGKLASLFTVSKKATGGGGSIISTGTTNAGSTGGGGGGGAVGSRGSMDATNLLPTLNLLPDQLKSATAETERLTQNTNAFKDAQIAAGNAVQVTDEKINLLKDSFARLNEGLKTIVDSTLNDLAIGFGEQLGNALSGAGFSIKALITPMADALAQFGKLAIQTGITAAGIKLALKPPINPAVAIAGGIALVALSSLVKSKMPALAEGGLATGPTMALVGDNKNARVDPEVIAPLSKLKSMLGDMGGGGGVLETRISGNDLIILLNRSQKTLNRVQ